MPSKNVIRDFSENSIYHVFNRGVEKRIIFQDEKDYRIFIYYLYIYLAPLDDVLRAYPTLPFRLQSKNLHSEVELLAYCLMPNHFHLLLKQHTRNGTSKLLKQLTNAYTLYFNQKNERVGGLVQGRFKAIRVVQDEILLHVARYIHLNPVVSGIVSDPKDYSWSSHLSYLDSDSSFINREAVLSYFPSRENYKSFIEDQVDYAKNLEKIKHFALED